MLTMNGKPLPANSAVNEVVQLHNMEWVRILALKLPKSEFTVKTAVAGLGGAKTIIETNNERVNTYHVGGIMTVKEGTEAVYVWLFIINSSHTENFQTKAAALEEENITAQQYITDLELEILETQQQLTETELMLLEGGLTDE